MIISFDIDNTLIPYSNEFEVEHKSILAKITGAEGIRKGTIELFKKLENRGHHIWIYTTSFRSIISLKRTFLAYGLRPRKIINQKINLQKLKANNSYVSKNPKLFGIDVHIDDAPGVKIEGDRNNFRVIIVEVCELNWVDKILEELE